MKRAVFILLLTFFCVTTEFLPLYAQETVSKNESFFIGLGGGISTYLGGAFGKMYAIRYKSHTNYDNYYYSPYGGRYYSRYYNRAGDEGMLYPIQFDLNLGYRISEPIAITIESSFIWHNAGRVDADPQLVTTEEEMYRDDFEPSSLFAVPVFTSVKVFPFGWHKNQLYLSVGYGVQYVSESVTKWRNYFYNSSWQGNMYSYSMPLEYYEDFGFIQGFKLAVGIDLAVSKYFFGSVELRFTNFYPHQKSNTPLALTNSSNMMNLALISRFFIPF
ncbi:MAG: hypothetical protein ACP5P3_01605 [Ignavibacteria bacterium]